MNTTVRKTIFWHLLLLSMIATAAVLPYALTLVGGIPEDIAAPLPAIIAIQIIQATAMFAIALHLGLKATSAIGIRLPVLQAYATKKDWKRQARKIMQPALTFGIVIGAVIMIGDMIFGMLSPDAIVTEAPPLWQSLLASIYGAVGEEILLRLFVMSTIAWIIWKLIYRAASKPPTAVYWSAIVLSTVIFGLGHLPITATLVDISPLIIARALLLNGVAGIGFGYLFWRHGLVAAMLAHLVTDILIHGLYPFLSYEKDPL